MFRKHSFAAVCVSIASLAASLGATGNKPAVQSIALHPFGNVGYVLADSDLSSIRFEGIRLVHVPAKLLVDNRFCEDQFRDPGGSIFCPITNYEARVPAYRVTYSYTGRRMASDEFPNRHPRYTFSVLFRPDQLDADTRAGHGGFVLSTRIDLVKQTVVDEANSHFCEGEHRDGHWVATHPRHCEDYYAFKTVWRPSQYVSVVVTPASWVAKGAASSQGSASRSAQPPKK
jgi:hypothetical protein